MNNEQVELIVTFLKKKIATNSRKWDRSQTTSDKIKFGGKARMCREILDYVLSVVLNDESNATQQKLNSSSDDGNKINHH